MTQQALLPDAASARLSPDGLHRYSLTRSWGDGEKLGWCMFNPSTADASANDATIRRCLGFARDWGYEGIVVVNLFSWRASDPKEVVRNLADAANTFTDAVLLEVAEECKTVVCAWGSAAAQKWGRERAETVTGLLQIHCPNLVCLGRSPVSRQPLHPLYLPKSTPLEPYRP